MRLSLALNTINPSIGGVLIRGERGTAKSTAVRGLAAGAVDDPRLAVSNVIIRVTEESL